MMQEGLIQALRDHQQWAILISLCASILVAIAGTIAFWWFVLPNSPAEAAADGITAGAIAGYAEIMISRFGG